VDKDQLLGVRAGFANLRATLQSDTSKHDEIQVEVVRNPKIPDSLRLQPDTLSVAVRGGAGQFSLTVFPQIATPSLIWRSSDSTAATISQSGNVVGLKSGFTRIWVASTDEESISDSAWVRVLEPVSVESVRFLKSSLTLFVGGVAESLYVLVTPPLANPNVVFALRDSSIARVDHGGVYGLKQGETWLIVKSQENATKVDSLKITVLSSQVVESVKVLPDSLRIFVGGESQLLSAKITPLSATAWVRWRSLNPLIADVDSLGMVKPVSQGKVYIIAISRADSTKKDSAMVVVKKDTPLLAVGGDTVVAIGAIAVFRPTFTQEYGKITRFDWDLDGDGNWDGGADSVKEVSTKYEKAQVVSARFHLRDSEGNDTTVAKKVTVVDGPVIRFISPANGSYSNQTIIDVSWSVDDTIQKSGVKETLTKDGANTITRQAKDATGKVYTAAITVYLDTVPPGKPIVGGNTPVNTKVPAWSWSSGGKGGIGTYRIRLDDEDMSGAKTVLDTAYVP